MKNSKKNAKKNGTRRNRALSKLRNAPIPKEVKTTLEALIDKVGPASNYSAAWPSVATLAEMTGQNDRTVRRHLKAIKEMGVFDYQYLTPAALISYVKQKYGYTIKPNFKNFQAPTLWEVNGHSLWSSQRRLPATVVEAMTAAVRAVNSHHNRKTTSRLVGSSEDKGTVANDTPEAFKGTVANDTPGTVANDTPGTVANDTEVCEGKGGASIASSFPSQGSADPSLIENQVRVRAKPAPERACSLTNRPTHRQFLQEAETLEDDDRSQSSDGGWDYDEYSLNSGKPSSGSRPSVSPLSNQDSLTQREADLESEDGLVFELESEDDWIFDPEPEDIQPEPPERDFFRLVSFGFSLEPPERDFSPPAGSLPPEAPSSGRNPVGSPPEASQRNPVGSPPPEAPQRNPVGSPPPSGPGKAPPFAPVGSAPAQGMSGGSEASDARKRPEEARELSGVEKLLAARAEREREKREKQEQYEKMLRATGWKPGDPIPGTSACVGVWTREGDRK